jgi:hypothetical protein
MRKLNEKGKIGLALVLLQDLRMHNLLDEASCYNDLGNNNCHLRRSQNSYNATYDYEKFYSRGFPATE